MSLNLRKSEHFTGSDSSNMLTRRNGPGVKILVVITVAGLFLYGIYLYSDLHTRLQKAEERAERYRQQHDSVSAQLQVVYEHKSRLEKSLQQEKTEHRKTKDDLTAEKLSIANKAKDEKSELLHRFESVNQQHQMLKSQHEDLQADFSRTQDNYNKLEEDHRKMGEQHTLEYQQMKQEKSNEIAVLKDQYADLARQKNEVESKFSALLAAAQQSNQQKQLAEQPLQQQQKNQVGQENLPLNQQQPDQAQVNQQNLPPSQQAGQVNLLPNESVHLGNDIQPPLAKSVQPERRANYLDAFRRSDYFRKQQGGNEFQIPQIQKPGEGLGFDADRLNMKPAAEQHGGDEAEIREQVQAPIMNKGIEISKRNDDFDDASQLNRRDYKEKDKLRKDLLEHKLDDYGFKRTDMEKGIDQEGPQANDDAVQRAEDGLDEDEDEDEDNELPEDGGDGDAKLEEKEVVDQQIEKPGIQALHEENQLQKPDKGINKDVDIDSRFVREHNNVDKIEDENVRYPEEDEDNPNNEEPEIR